MRCLLLVPLLLAGVSCEREKTIKRAITIFKNRDKEVLDETLSANPDAQYDFSDDLRNEVDVDDAYDQLVPALPKFNVYKNHKNQGFTRVPIVTRRWNMWSTPSTRYQVNDGVWRTTPSFLPTTTQAPPPTKRTRAPSVATTERPPAPAQPQPAFKPDPVPLAPQPAPAFIPQQTTHKPTNVQDEQWPQRQQSRDRQHNWQAPTTQQPVFATTARPFVRTTAEPGMTAVPKPVVIAHPEYRHHGPTFNCRVLNPLEDAQASPRHDATCEMSMPGFSADGSCRCLYEVAARDEYGCATGFTYSCQHLFKRN